MQLLPHVDIPAAGGECLEDMLPRHRALRQRIRHHVACVDTVDAVQAPAVQMIP